MRRKTVLISALFMIGIAGGIAIGQIMSNTEIFTVQVDSTNALNVDLIKEPTGPLYQGQLYTDALVLNVSNNDVNQGYNFYLVVKVVHSGVTPSNIQMQIKHSEGNQANYGDYKDISFVQEASNTVNGTYYKVTTIPIDKYDTGNWKVFFMIQFEIIGASSGQFSFQFTAYN